MRVDFLSSWAGKKAAKGRHTKRRARQWLIERLESRQCLAVTSLVSDINRTPVPYPEVNGSVSIVEAGGLAYFAATSQAFGAELWRSDGTAEGTVQVADIRAGVSGSDPSNLINVNSLLFFAATTDNGTELWKSDGTTAGTVLVKDIWPGSSSSGLSNFVNVNGILYFTANDGISGVELWKSDGTSQGTAMVADLRAGLSGASPSNLVNFNGTLFFQANDGSTGYELWKSDGIPGGTVPVKDIRAGASSASPANLTALSDALYFVANDGTTGSELWRTDGTLVGTVRVKDIQVGSVSSRIEHLTNVNDMLYFRADDGLTGAEIWKSDGTDAGTTQLIDLKFGEYGSNPRSLINHNGKLLFVADDSNNDYTYDGYGIWSSDGSTSGTLLVRSFGGAYVPYGYFFNPYVVSDMSSINGTVYFRAGSNSGVEPWISDGLSSGTKQLTDLNPGGSSNPRGFIGFGDKAVFSAGIGEGTAVWISNGTESGTVTLSRYHTSNSNPGSGGGLLTNVNGELFFAATDSSQFDSGLWKTDGTDAGTTVLKDINSRFVSYGVPQELTNLNGALFFTLAYFDYDEGKNHVDLWTSDGTMEGTSIVEGVRSHHQHLTNVGGVLYFTARDSYFGELLLWKSDGTSSGTTAVTDVSFVTDGVKHLTNVNGTLYFVADDGSSGLELWKSDGTSAGTVRVKDIRVGSNGSSPRYLTNVNGTLMFASNDGTSGYELWKSDGTDAGTVRVRDIVAGANGASPIALTNVNGTVYFSAQASGGRELWKSDGTSAGTVRVKDINGAQSSFPSNLVNANGKLFFVAYEAAFGNELWVTDGTDAGTVRLRDINPGAASSAQSNHVNINGVVFFSANDGTRGFEVWRSDGTDIGTHPVTDINQFGSSFPEQFTLLDNQLIYAATSIETGRELWSTDLGLQFSGVRGSVSRGNHVAYTENGARQQIAPQARILDYDSPDFAGGQFLVRFTSNGHVDDRFAIRTAGFVSTNASNQVLYGGVVIGTFTGGTGLTPLTINFNSNSTIGYAQSVLRNIVYSSVSENPPTAVKAYSVEVSRGTESFTEANQIVVTRVNDIPVLGNVSGSIGGGTNIAYVENAAPVSIAGLGTVTDVDSLSFDTGTLTVQFTANANSTDRLGIRSTATLTTAGNQVRHQGVAFGTFTGGVGTTPLVFTFNSNATPGKVQLLLRNIVYSNISDNPTTSPRTFQVQMTDGDGGTSLARTNQITITRTNDAPTLANFGGALSYAHNANSIQVSSTATVIDPDSTNFAGGVLTVSITQGSNASNQILISGGGFSWDASNNLLLNGVIVGTRNAGGGLGTTELKITLRSTANASVVQDLMRAVRFKTVGSTSTAQRVIAVKLTDGDGGTSNTVSKAINIV